MKAYKIRSLIYLTFFVIAAVIYYHVEQNDKMEKAIFTSQTADIQLEDEAEKELKENTALKTKH